MQVRSIASLPPLLDTWLRSFVYRLWIFEGGRLQTYVPMYVFLCQSTIYSAVCLFWCCSAPQDEPRGGNDCDVREAGVKYIIIQFDEISRMAALFCPVSYPLLTFTDGLCCSVVRSIALGGGA